MIGYLRLVITIWPFVAIWLFVDLLAIFVGNILGLKVSNPPLSLVVPLSLIFNPFIFPIMEMYDPELTPIDEDLTEKVKNLAARMGISPVPVRRLVGRTGTSQINAWVKHDTIFVTEKAISRLRDVEIDFLLGHELGHLRRIRHRKRVLKHPILILCFVAILPVLTVARVDFLWQTRVLALVALFSALVVFTVWLAHRAPLSGKAIELECDLIGAELCGDFEAAYAALDKLTAEENPVDSKLSSYPTRDERLGQIRDLQVA